MKQTAVLSSLAGAMLLTTSLQAAHVDAFVTGGAVMPRLVNTSTVLVYPGFVNQYSTQRKTLTGSIWGGGAALGSTFLTRFPLDATLGLAGYAVDFRHVTGLKKPFVNRGDFDPSYYSFGAKSSLGMVEGRLFYTGDTWQPYVLAGVGTAHNTLRTYRESPLGTAIVGQLFTQASHQAFAVEAGFGLKHALLQDKAGVSYALALDYRYLNVGAGHLGAFTGQTTSSRLHIDHLETDALTLTLSATL